MHILELFLGKLLADNRKRSSQSHRSASDRLTATGCLGEKEAKRHLEGPNPGLGLGPTAYAFLQDPASCKAQKIKTKQIKASFFLNLGLLIQTACMLSLST